MSATDLASPTEKYHIKKSYKKFWEIDITFLGKCWNFFGKRLKRSFKISAKIWPPHFWSSRSASDGRIHYTIYSGIKSLGLSVAITQNASSTAGFRPSLPSGFIDDSCIVRCAMKICPAWLSVQINLDINISILHGLCQSPSVHPTWALPISILQGLYWSQSHKDCWISYTKV